ncbi:MULTISPECIES: hypothetical protein [unclassified Bradyrhizobium]|uniref:hypothetical protein n=1 Tax=unclassified Bradyrhizobium TaxID=2631580 RepID=UPI0029163926|nr:MULTISPECIES: hypothetical protein [unclassified Bradyrhizobium]
MANRSLPPEIGKYVSIWWRSSTGWLLLFFALGVTGVGVPALIATGIVQDANDTKWLALIATIVSGLQTLLRCDSRADRFHVAYRILNAAKFKFEHNENYPVSDVIDAYERGERLIESAFAPETSPAQISN